MAFAVVALVLACVLGLGGAAAAQTTPPSAQILTAADVSGVAVGAWTGTCSYFGVAGSPAIRCTISRGDQGDGLRTLTLQMDPIPSGTSVAAARAAWRPTVDAQVATGSQTLQALTGLGDEAYLVTGTGASADMAMLMFFADGNNGMLQAAIDVAADAGASAPPDPVIGDRLVRLGQIALPRFEAQLGTAASAPTPDRTRPHRTRRSTG